MVCAMDKEIFGGLVKEGCRLLVLSPLLDEYAKGSFNALHIDYLHNARRQML